MIATNIIVLRRAGIMKRFSHVLLLGTALSCHVGSDASAANLVFKVSNQSVQSLSSIKALSRLSGAVASVALTGIAAGATGTLTLTQTGNDGTDCVYDLRLQFATKITDITSVDLCQTDVLVVQ
jgi:hypothetical protein